MATLTREWVSVERARHWFEHYEPNALSDAIVQAATRARNPRRREQWLSAIIVDATTDICHDGLHRLQAILKAEAGAMCWVARATDFHFSQARLEHTPQGPMVITRQMDTVHTDPLTLPYETIPREDPMPRHRVDPPDPEPARTLAQALGDDVPAEELRLLLSCREHPPGWPPSLPWPLPKDLSVLSTSQLKLLVGTLRQQCLFVHEALISNSFKFIEEALISVASAIELARVELRQSALSVGAHIRQSRRAMAQAQQARPPMPPPPPEVVTLVHEATGSEQARPPTPPEIPGGPETDGATHL